MLDLPENTYRFRRPFSVLSNPTPDTFDLYYKVVGYGTTAMAEFQIGQKLRCLGPLGNTFTRPADSEHSLFIAGGIGIAPLLFLRAKIQEQNPGAEIGHCIYGARGQNELGLQDELNAIFPQQNLHFTTDDGSAGFHGNVVQLLQSKPELVQKAKKAYICGPSRMMEAVCNHLTSINPSIEIQVSLESHMPCGTGACTGCVIPRPAPNLPAKVCFEGPIFNANDILWHFADEAPCFPTTDFPGQDEKTACQ